MKKIAMRGEFEFSKGVRGKYAARFAKSTNVVLLAPDEAKAFPDSESVNQALRLIVCAAERLVGK
jgi:hypothetical protein